jgi:putative endonuclease
MNTYYVYIVKCTDQSYYTGFTNNIERRLHGHNHGINPDCYTYKRRPVKLMFIQDFSNPKDAITDEKQIKGWSREKKEVLFQGDWNKIHESAKCKNSTSHINYKKDIP